MQIIYIYNKNLEIVSQPWCKDLQTFDKNPLRYFKYWNDDCYASTVKFDRPIWDSGIVREITREEICESGDLSVLSEGEVWEDSVIKTIPIPDNLFKPKWEYPNWVESATIQEKEDIHNQLINQLKDEILTIGFEYIQKNETKHQQKTRDKDRSFLDSSISSMKRQSIPSIFWSFNDEDIVELTLQELEDLQDDGFEFNQAVFKVEAELKAEPPTKNVTIDTYRQKVNAISSIKCFEK